jgi:hypothetical protein
MRSAFDPCRLFPKSPGTKCQSMLIDKPIPCWSLMKMESAALTFAGLWLT